MMVCSYGYIESIFHPFHLQGNRKCELEAQTRMASCSASALPIQFSPLKRARGHESLSLMGQDPNVKFDADAIKVDVKGAALEISQGLWPSV